MADKREFYHLSPEEEMALRQAHRASVKVASHPAAPRAEEMTDTVAAIKAQIEGYDEDEGVIICASQMRTILASLLAAEQERDRLAGELAEVRAVLKPKLEQPGDKSYLAALIKAERELAEEDHNTLTARLSSAEATVREATIRECAGIASKSVAYFESLVQQSITGEYQERWRACAAAVKDIEAAILALLQPERADG